jgi:hypothetical protein
MRRTNLPKGELEKPVQELWTVRHDLKQIAFNSAGGVEGRWTSAIDLARQVLSDRNDMIELQIWRSLSHCRFSCARRQFYR